MEKQKNKKVGVLFSGGLDSTYLVWKNLKDGNTVVPIYIEISNNRVKTVMEKNRIEQLHKRFREEFDDGKVYYDSQLKDIQYALTVDVLATEESLYFKQVPIWILGILFSQGLEVDEIQIGYVGNDDAISYLQDIKKIYKSYQSMSEPLVPLVFPLVKERKYDVAKELPYHYRELIFSCEDARIIGSEDAEVIQYEPCCRCTPCKTIISTEYYGQGFPDIYNKQIRNKQVRELVWAGYTVLDKEGKELGSDEKLVCAPPEPHQLRLPLVFNDEIGCDLLAKAEKVPELN